MLVRELIAKLMETNPDAQVVVYSRIDEGADWATGVMVSTPGETEGRPYVKGDWPDYGSKQKGQIVIIR